MTTQLAIETWTLAWSAIREEFRARLRGLPNLAPWWEQARLLDVMACAYEDARGIHRCYNQRRGTNLLLSPTDWALVATWLEAGIPQCAITSAIHEMFDLRDRSLRAHQINSVAYCAQAVYRVAEEMKEASVGGSYYSHRFKAEPTRYTLLLALPPAGRMTFAAMQSERQVDRVAEIFQVGIVFTVYPDAWHKSEAQARYGVDLEFLDEAPGNDSDPAYLFSGSKAGGRPDTTSRRPFLKNGNLHHGVNHPSKPTSGLLGTPNTEARSGSKLQESPAMDIPAAADGHGSGAPATHGKTQPLSNGTLHPPIGTAELHPSKVHAELGGRLA